MAEGDGGGSRGGAAYQRIWGVCATVSSVLWPLRLNIILAIIAWYAICGVDQSLDAQRALINEFAADGLRRRFVVTVLACAAFAGNLWFWSRTTLDIVFPDGLTNPLARRVATWAPRVLGVVPPLAMAFATYTLFPDTADSRQFGQSVLQLIVAMCAWLALAAGLMYSYILRRQVIESLDAKRARNERLGFLGHFAKPTSDDARIVVLLDYILPKFLSRLAFTATGLRRLSPAAQVSLIAGFFLGAIMIFFAIFEPGFAAGFDVGFIIPVGPLATLMLGIAIWVVILHPFMVASVKWRFPLVLFIVITFGVSGWLERNQNHSVRFLRAAPGVRPAEIEEDFRAWIKERNQPGRPFPVFVVATEGGGIRAAYFTSLVLSILDRDVPHFRSHLYAVSGVSGGSVGAAVYATMVRNQELSPEPAAGAQTEEVDRDVLIRHTQRILSRDLLSPVLARALTSDLAIEAVPWVPDVGERLALPDRARALEHAAEEAYFDAVGSTPAYSMSRSFYGLRPRPGGAEPSDVPALVLNTTRVETGERIVVSHLTLEPVQATARPDVSPSTNEYIPEGPPLNPVALHSLVERDLAVSTAAFLSARFPVVTPVGTFVAPDPRFGGKPMKHRLADGGYFENSGTATALNLVHRLAAAIETARQEASGDPLADACIHVIQLRFREYPPEDKHTYEEIASPLRALLNTRGARGELSRDTLHHALRLIEHPERPLTPIPEADAAQNSGVTAPEHDDEAPVDDDVICFEYVSGKIPIPLGWFLSTPACRSIELQLGYEDKEAKAADAVRERLSDAAQAIARRNAESVATIREHLRR